MWLCLLFTVHSLRLITKHLIMHKGGKAGGSRYCSSIRVDGGLREESPVVISEKKTIEYSSLEHVERENVAVRESWPW